MNLKFFFKYGIIFLYSKKSRRNSMENMQIKQDMSMIDIAFILLTEYSNNHKTERTITPTKKKKSKKPEPRTSIPKGIYFYDLFNKIAEIKGFTEQQKEDKISYFYTDLTLSGKFIMTGENYWDLASDHTLAERTTAAINAYDDDYDEEAIREAKERYLKLKKMKSGDLSDNDMQYIMDHIDELISEDDVEIEVEEDEDEVVGKYFEE